MHVSIKLCITFILQVSHNSNGPYYVILHRWDLSLGQIIGVSSEQMNSRENGTRQFTVAKSCVLMYIPDSCCDPYKIYRLCWILSFKLYILCCYSNQVIWSYDQRYTTFFKPFQNFTKFTISPGVSYCLPTPSGELKQNGCIECCSFAETSAACV